MHARTRSTGHKVGQGCGDAQMMGWMKGGHDEKLLYNLPPQPASCGVIVSDKVWFVCYSSAHFVRTYFL